MPDPNDPRLRMARYLRRLSMFTRGIAIVAIVGGVIGMFAALGESRSGDRIALSMVALGAIVIALLVWGIGTFHGATAEALPTLVAVDDKLDKLGRLIASLPSPPASPAPGPAPGPALAPAPGGEIEALTADDIRTEPLATPPLATPAEPEPPKAVVRAPEPEPVRTPCPHCGGLVHPEATRCVHCMRKIKR